MPPFVLVDGSYFLFRAYHALPPLTTSTGLQTNAIRGAISAIQKLMRRIQPSHMAVIFDTPEPTFRHALSASYKGDRPSMPDELSQQIPYLHALIRALGIPLHTLPGAEADDVIGTLAKRAEAAGYQVLISTGVSSSQGTPARVSCDTAVRMMLDMGAHAAKFFPMGGERSLPELYALATTVARNGMTLIEPTGGIDLDNFSVILKTCLEAGVPRIMPHVYSSIIDPDTGYTRPDDVAVLLNKVKSLL